MTMLKIRPNSTVTEHYRDPAIPLVPDHMRIYAVGDVHGRLDLLTALQAAIDEDMAAHPGPDCVEVYLGDYVDRGAQSSGVLDALMRRQKDHKAICISGNHEAVMLESLLSQESFSRWLRMGGLETVFSYVRPAAGADEAGSGTSGAPPCPPSTSRSCASSPAISSAGTTRSSTPACARASRWKSRAART